MAKSGRLFVPIDVNWYDEWGYAVSADAALFWILALTTAKRMRGNGELTLGQLRRVAPSGMTEERFVEVVQELSDCPVAPVTLVDDVIRLHGWSHWNDVGKDFADATEAAIYGNHVRWHVKSGNPSEDCGYCSSTIDVIDASSPRHRPDDRPDDRPESGDDDRPESSDDDRPESKRREEKSREEIMNGRSGQSSTTYEAEFDECWKHYPRKVARKTALKAFIAQRRKAVPAETLLIAVKHYAEAMKREERAVERILHLSTFFGPDDRFEDYLEPPEALRPPVIASGAGRLSLADYESEMGERIVLPGDQP
jgi:hypothetical protein